MSASDFVEKQLRALNPKQVPKVPHCKEPIFALVYKVYDGDTSKILFLHDQTAPMKLSVRVDGIDTPELHPKTDPDVDPEQDLERRRLESSVAKAVRDHVEKLIGDRMVMVCFQKWDKYGGRVVASLHFRREGSSAIWTSLKDHLLARGLANPYDGTKKTKFDVDRLLQIQRQLEIPRT